MASTRLRSSKDAREHFLAIFQESLSRWRRNVLDSVVTEYRDLLAPDAAENDLSKLRASPALAQCVLRMVDAVNRIGLSSMDLEAYQVAEHLLRAFLQRLLSLEWNGQRPLQASWDLAFTQHLVASFEPPHHVRISLHVLIFTTLSQWGSYLDRQTANLLSTISKRPLIYNLHDGKCCWVLLSDLPLNRAHLQNPQLARTPIQSCYLLVRLLPRRISRLLFNS